jgi:hypothetical protein
VSNLDAEAVLEELGAAIAAVGGADEPQERPEALAAMRRAADEWIDVAADENARDAYLHRWMFDVLGLDRSIGREF